MDLYLLQNISVKILVKTNIANSEAVTNKHDNLKKNMYLQRKNEKSLMD